MKNVINRLLPFGLKPRLLALLSLLTSAALLVFASVTLNLFRNDRLSYVFENQARVAENVAAQVDARLEVLENRLSPSKRELGDAKLRGEKGFLFEARADSAKSSSYQVWLYSVRNTVPNIWDGVFSLSELLPEKFSKGGAELFLVDDHAKVVRARNGEVVPSGEAYSRILETPVLTGAQDDGEVLRSYQKLPEWGLMVVIESSKTEAFAALESVVMKGLFVAFLVLGFSLILSIVFSNSLVGPLRRLKDVSEEVSTGNLDVSASEHRFDEIGVLGHSFNAMTRDIKRLLEETKEKARMQSELETASLVQATLFPKDEIRLNSFEIDAYHESATECGGDCWFQLLHEGHLYLVLGDATGHGAPAALVTSAVHSALHVLGEYIIGGQKAAYATSDIMRVLSSAVFNCSKGDIKMTAVVIRVDEKTGRTTYSNASHEMPVHLSFSKDSSERIHILDGEPGPPLGSPTQARWIEHECQLEKGDVVLAYTDGLTELPSTSGELFGEGRLVRWIKKTDTKNSKSLKGELLELVGRHKQGLGANPDDLTFVFLGLVSEEERV